MKKSLFSIILIVIAASGLTFNLFMTTPVKTAEAKTQHTIIGPNSFADLVDGLMPAVVNISSTQKVHDPKEAPGFPEFPPGSPFEEFLEEFMKRRGQSGPVVPPSSLGSGFVIDAKNGYIITNNHVIQDAEEVRVTFSDDETIEAEIIGNDEKTDLAILKVDPTKKKLTDVKFGDSEHLRIGDWVVAIGNPFGLGGTVTAGIISAQKRDINAGPYDNFIQTDASINRGNSGGPMFNLHGEVIGINTAIFSPTGGSVGIGFAIPASIAKPVVEQIIKYGRTRRGWLGVRVQKVTEEIADSLGLEKEKGALVANVTAKGPAEAAGIQPGDIILKFDGKDIGEMRDLPLIVAETEIGKAVDVVVWRNSENVTLKAEVAELEKAEDEGLLETATQQAGEVIIDSFGITIAPLTVGNREKYGIGDDVQGVVIVEVKDLSEAAEKRLIEGTVILEINQQPIKSPEEASKIITDAQTASRSSVLMLISYEGDDRFVALRFQ